MTHNIHAQSNARSSVRATNKLVAAVASAAMVASLCPLSVAYAQEAPLTERGLSGVSAAMHEVHDGTVVLEADAVTIAKNLIAVLPSAPQITAAGAGVYDDQVAAAVAAYEALDEADKKALDAAQAPGSSQSYGRVLENAQWAAAAMHEVDASTTLAPGTYDASSAPVLSSEYSKGKSTSSRQRPWSVKDVTVTDGKAYGTVTVESDSYTYIYMAGQKFENTAKTGHSTFENVPIDLNSTQYLTAYSTSMMTEIVFSLTTTIDESATPGGGDNPGEKPGGGDPSEPGENPGGGDKPGENPGQEEGFTAQQVVALIQALPSDPYEIGMSYIPQVYHAQEAYDSLNADDKATVDIFPLPSGVACKRALEVANWAVKSLDTIDNTTTLADGTYNVEPGKIRTDMGSSVSKREFYWYATKIVVVNGKATATFVRSGGNTPVDSVYYQGRVFSVSNDTFRMPIALNSDMYFSTKSAMSVGSTVGLAYHLDTTFDVENATPDGPAENDPSQENPDDNTGAGDAGGENGTKTDGNGSSNGAATNRSGAAGSGAALSGVSSASGKSATDKSGAASSGANGDDAGVATMSAADGARTAGAVGMSDESDVEIPPLAVGGGFAGVALAGGAGFFALFRKREQH